LAIHVRKRGRNPKSFDLATVAKGTENFSGAELENVVIEAMHLGFDDCKREFTSEDMMLAVHNCKPLANVDVMRDTISQLREESRGRMRKASESLYSRTENELESISKFARLPKGKQNENENK
jgi:SpoVK/Ycf46/Vps4 family AAA+-type ATPase